MALQYGQAVAFAKLNAIASTIGTTARLRIYSGSAPATVATAATGTVLADISLASGYLATASGSPASVAKAGTWQDTSADATGTAGYFRILDSTATTSHLQGTVGTTGTDMIVDSVSFTAGQ